MRPFLEAKAKIYGLAQPSLVIEHNNRVTRVYNFTPEQLKTLALMDEGIATVFDEASKALVEDLKKL